MNTEINIMVNNQKNKIPDRLGRKRKESTDISKVRIGKYFEIKNIDDRDH